MGTGKTLLCRVRKIYIYLWFLQCWVKVQRMKAEGWRGVQGLPQADGGVSTGCQPCSVDGPSPSLCAGCRCVPMYTPATTDPMAKDSRIPGVWLQDVSPAAQRGAFPLWGPREGKAASCLCRCRSHP